MDKITTSAYLVMHLTTTDFIACFAGTIIRGCFDWYNARMKVKKCKTEAFSNSIYFRENGDKVFVSLVSSIGLIFFIPELTIYLAEWITGRNIVWNSGFSGVIGLMAFDIVNTIFKRAKLELKRLQSRNDANNENEGDENN